MLVDYIVSVLYAILAQYYHLQYCPNIIICNFVPILSAILSAILILSQYYLQYCPNIAPLFPSPGGRQEVGCGARAGGLRHVQARRGVPGADGLHRQLPVDCPQGTRLRGPQSQVRPRQRPSQQPSEYPTKITSFV